MSAEEFLANFEGGIVPVTCHEDVLRIAFIYLHDGLWTGCSMLWRSYTRMACPLGRAIYALIGKLVFHTMTILPAQWIHNNLYIIVPWTYSTSHS